MDYINEGRNLFSRLYNLHNIVVRKAEFENDLVRYEKICRYYDDNWEEPFIKIRLAKYFRAECYMFDQKVIQAERAFLDALAADAPIETSRAVSVAKIKAELLQIYFSWENLSSAVPLLRELLSMIRNESEHGLSMRDIYCIYTINNYIYGNRMSMADRDDLRRMLLRLHKDIEQKEFVMEDGIEALGIFVFTSILSLSEYEYLSDEDCRIYREIAQHFDAIREVFSSNINMRMLMYQVLARTTRGSGLQKEKYISECLKLAGSNEVAIESKIEMLQPAALFYYQKGRSALGERCLYKCLDMLTQTWHSDVRYINDKRLYQTLGTVQLQFLECYSMIHGYFDKTFAYEKVLQFKELASLAVRERNKICYNSALNRQLKLSEIHNKMADREVNRLWNGIPTDDMKDTIYLRNLDAEEEFYEQFPRDAAFTDITWEKVRDAVPNDSAVIEYFFFEEASEAFEGRRHAPATPIDLYIIRKKNDRCTLDREVILDGKHTLKEAREFVSILQKESDSTLTLKEEELKEELRIRLYRRLIIPFLGYLQGIHRLYIAPDKDLINLPFGILHDEDNVQLEIKYDVIQMECARDFLFSYKERFFSKGSLVIGGPQYEVMAQDFEPVETKGFDDKVNAAWGNNPLEPLPYSKVEARLVSQYCDSRYYTDENARKSLLISAKGYRNIHIATHGSFDLENKSEAIYSSCLAFAGADNWRRTGKISKKYGNGIVTADEISRLDLHSVELAVISACKGSMNSVLEDKGFHGLLGGFSAAGVRYVISNLWSVDDFATMLLMAFFYSEYIEGRQEPYCALRNAKQSLRRITIGQLRKRRWFDYLLKQGIEQELIQEYAECNDWEKPFENEIYWGGFVCYQCN